MKKQIEDRLLELQAEYQKGEQRLAELEQEITKVKSTMLRISGALQVLEELKGDIEVHETLPEPEN